MLFILCVINILISSINCEDAANNGIIDIEGTKYKEAHPEMFETQSKCYPEVGCFTNGLAWSEKRPFSVVPEDVKVNYGLFTPNNPQNAYMMDMSTESIKKSPFNPNVPTQILIHGYNPDQSAVKFIMDFKDAVLSVGNCNVLVADFRDYMKMPYFQAVANIRVAAARIAQLLTKILTVTGARAQDFHLTGPNLGAQTCGYVGKLVPNIGRITALSPVSAYFDGTAKFVHLTDSDALFVDVIHTADYAKLLFGFDNNEPVGDQDFYVNGGFPQPGCNPSAIQPSKYVNYSALFDTTFCDHHRSDELYLESVRLTNCTFKAVECGSYEEFQDKKCSAENSREAEMGFYAEPIPGQNPKTKFYLKTRDGKPYCDNNKDVPPEDNDSICQCIMKSILDLFS